MTGTDLRLPDPRTPGRYRLALVCLGNICRSPMAHVVLEAELERAGLDDRVEVRSAGTADYHVGAPMDRRAAATLTTSGYDASRHRAQQVEPSWAAELDLVLAMDRSNLDDLVALADAEHADRVRLFRDLDPRAEDPADVPDPYYGGDDGFDEVLAIVTRTSRALVERLRAVLG
jgi:protein-tyrosine phosphatase